MKQYDFVIPVGESCITSFNLRRLGLQMCSYPFDWLMDFKLESFLYYLDDDFSDFLRKENLVPYLDIPATSCWHYRDILTNILFVHCFRRPHPLSETFQIVKSQFDRRIERFKRHLKNSKNVLLVYVSKKDNYSDDYLIAYQQRLAVLYPKCNIEFMYILTVKKSGVYTEKKIDAGLYKVVMSYSDEDLEPGEGEGNRWQGLPFLFDRALSSVEIPQHRILKLGCRVLSFLIPVKKLRSFVRNFWYKHYYG